MNIIKAYAKRESLDPVQLERLEQALVDDIHRYKAATQNYPADRWEKYGLPFLQGLEEKLSDVQRLLKKASQ